MTELPDYPDFPNFTDYIGCLLIYAVKAHRRQVESALNALGIHVGQELLLFRLWEKDGVTQSELAACLCVEPPTVTKMLQRMEAAGFVERRQDSQDGRVSRVYLTPKGYELKDGVYGLWSDLETLTIKGLSESEKLLLRRLLMQIQENLVDNKL